ncbi:MAG: methyltransferase domain-containing protein [Planctomycetales bacterium]|nr:methyltransferase domain-containing protein [Planctomycetales bacterium]
MRRQHFELFRPVCPVCRTEPSAFHFLDLAHIDKERDDQIIEGLLHCSNISCQREYPIIDGIPLIIADIRRYLTDNAFQVCLRSDLGAMIESVLGDCCGPGSSFDAVRQQLSSYTWDHYGDLDPMEPSSDLGPGSMERVLEQGLAMADVSGFDSGPILDIGCSVGRSSFALAQRFDQPVLGIDLNFPMLRLAGKVLRDGSVCYPRRRVGVVYDRREFPVSFRNSANVDFWACDATALPIGSNRIGGAVSMNLLDCVHSPLEFLASTASVLRPGASAVIACPYDWSVAVTAMEGWFGGHSQRGPDAGESEPVLRRLLTPGQPQSIPNLELAAEDNFPWHVRMHDRSIVAYQCHTVVARKTDQLADA